MTLMKMAVERELSVAIDGAEEQSLPKPFPSDASDLGIEADLLAFAATFARRYSSRKPTIYWTDMSLSAGAGWLMVVLAICSSHSVLTGSAILLAVLLLYRAASFVHELSHLPRGELPGFRTAWNILVGIPLLIPSFMYEGVHNQHHTKTRYGTSADPEYLPLASMPFKVTITFLATSFLVPFLLLFRFGILTPLSFVIPSLRETVITRFSALAINPAYRRRQPTGSFRTQWLRQEAAASVWSLALILSPWIWGWRPLVIYLVTLSVVAFLNQIRTLTAHLWESQGMQMSVTEQYLDSVNVPPPELLPALWAPVGLRYHALHHLLPGVPYHSLGQAHQQMMKIPQIKSVYTKTNRSGILRMLSEIRNKALTRKV